MGWEEKGLGSTGMEKLSGKKEDWGFRLAKKLSGKREI